MDDAHVFAQGAPSPQAPPPEPPTTTTTAGPATPTATPAAQHTLDDAVRDDLITQTLMNQYLDELARQQWRTLALVADAVPTTTQRAADDADAAEGVHNKLPGKARSALPPVRRHPMATRSMHKAASSSAPPVHIARPAASQPLANDDASGQDSPPRKRQRKARQVRAPTAGQAAASTSAPYAGVAQSVSAAGDLCTAAAGLSASTSAPSPPAAPRRQRHAGGRAAAGPLDSTTLVALASHAIFDRVTKFLPATEHGVLCRSWPMTPLQPHEGGVLQCKCTRPGCSAVARWAPSPDGSHRHTHSLHNHPALAPATTALPAGAPARAGSRALGRAMQAARSPLAPGTPPAAASTASAEAHDAGTPGSTHVPQAAVAAPAAAAGDPSLPSAERRTFTSPEYDDLRTSAPLHSLLGSIKIQYPAFGPLQPLAGGAKVSLCSHPGCQGTLRFVPVETAPGAARTYGVTHTRHNHGPKTPPPTLPPKDVRQHIRLKWKAWRDAPTYTSALGAPLPLKLDRPIPTLRLSTPHGGFISAFEYNTDTPLPKPPSPDLHEITNYTTAFKLLDKAGYTLEEGRPWRVFDLARSTATTKAYEELNRFATIADLDVHSNWNTRRSAESRANGNVQEDMVKWWADYMEAAPHGLLELGGQQAIIFGTTEAKGDAATGGGHSMLRRVPLMAVGQARDAVGLRAAILEACQIIDDANGWANISDHFDGTFDMAGFASPPRVCHTAVAYQAQNESAAKADFDSSLVHHTLERLARRVWDATCQDVAPWLEDHRRGFLSPAGHAACYVSTFTNLVSRTRNCAVSLHVDTSDGPYSIIVWLNKCPGPVAGAAPDAPAPSLHGGAFAMPGVCAQVTPLDMTILVIAGGHVTHGTMPVVATGGAERLGFSLFARMPALERIAVMATNAGGQVPLLHEQWAHTRAQLAAPPGPARKAERDNAFTWREALLKQPKGAPSISCYAGHREPGSKWPEGADEALYTIEPST